MARREVTGRKPGVNADPAKPEDRDDKPQPPVLAMTIPMVCRAHNISDGMYFKLKKQGKGPREMRVGSRVLISFESAAVWRIDCEAEAVASAEANAAKVEARTKAAKAAATAKLSKIAAKPKRKAKANAEAVTA